MPTGRVVEYYETVILGILEEKENEEVSEAEEYEVEEDEGKDDSTWASWLKEIYSYIDYIETTYIGKRSVVSTRNQTTVPRRKPLFKHNLWNEFKLVRRRRRWFRRRAPTICWSPLTEFSTRCWATTPTSSRPLTASSARRPRLAEFW